jgi:hypothetical protein
MAAQLTINQALGAGAGIAGEARNDIWEGQVVSLVSTGGTVWLWELLSKPNGSTATLATPTAMTATITPDTTGTYRVRLTEDGTTRQTRVFRVRYDNAGALKNRGWALPAVDEGEDEGVDEANYGTNTRGWDEPWDFITDDIRDTLDDLELPNLVFRPGGTADGHIYTSWSLLMDAFATTEGPIYIAIDDSVTSPAVIPNGTWDLEGRGILVSATSADAVVTLGDGVAVTILQAPAGFERIDLTTVNHANTGTIEPGTAPLSFYMLNTTIASGTAAGLAIYADNASKIYLRGLSLLRGANPVYNSAGGDSSEIWVQDSSEIAASMISYAGNVTVNVVGASAACHATQVNAGGTLTINEPSVGGAGAAFVYQPGGAASGNVYTSWALLMAAHALVTGPRIIEFDNSSAECSIPAGTWDLGNETTLTARWFGQGNETRVLMEAGAVFANASIIEGGITIYSRSNAAIFSFTSWADGSSAIYLRGNASLSLFTDTVAPTSSLIEVPVGGAFILYMADSSALKIPIGSIYNIVKCLGAGNVLVHLHGGDVIGNSLFNPLAGDAFEPGGGGGLIDVYFYNDGITFVQSAKIGLTLHKFTDRSVSVPLTKGVFTNSLTTPASCGACYVEFARLPNHPNLTCKFRAVIETTSGTAGYEAYVDLYDVHGQLNAGVPVVVTGSQIDTGSGSAPTGAPTPNALVPSVYEVDLTTAIVGGTWVSGIIVLEARLWLGTFGGGNAATCKSAELVFEW